MQRDDFYDILFEPVKIGPKTTKNRFFQSPHSTGMGYLMPQSLAATREVKAEGGWGVVCTEYCSIHPTSDDTPLGFSTLWDEDDVKNQALMVEKVHSHGALAGVQLWHGGSREGNLLSREIPLGVMSSPRHAFYDPIQSKAMDKKDMREMRRWQVAATRRAIRAGFDIVYVYATHGYLLAQFLSRELNQRSDEYGGSLENRVRFLREMIEDTKEAAGDDCAVAVRIAADGEGSLNGAIDNQEQREMIEMLADLPDLWDININDSYKEMGSSRFNKEAALEDYVSYVKGITNKPVVSVGRFTSPDTMVRQIKKGYIDLISAARPSIADPFLPEKIKEGRFEEIRECIGCNICFGSYFRAVPIRCTQNPTMGEEWRRGWHPENIPPKKSDDKILVVGAGPAGLEAARALGQRGYAVTLAEATEELGGRVLTESHLPTLSEWIRVCDYRIQQFKKMDNIEVFRDSRLTVEHILEYDFDPVVLATGSTWRRDGVGRWHTKPVKGFEDQRVFTPDDVMKGIDLKGPVIIFDDDHYYMGAVIAEKLRGEGLEVSLVTPAGEVAFWCRNTFEQINTQKRLLDLGVEIFTSKAVTGFDGESADISCVYTEKSFRKSAASILTITARIPNDELYRQLQDHGGHNKKSVFRIGDCMAPGTIALAVYAGHRLAREIDSPKIEDVSFRRERVIV